MNRRPLTVEYTLKQHANRMSAGECGCCPRFRFCGASLLNCPHRLANRIWNLSFSFICALLYAGHCCLYVGFFVTVSVTVTVCVVVVDPSTFWHRFSRYSTAKMCLHFCSRNSQSGQLHDGRSGLSRTVYFPPADCDGTNHSRRAVLGGTSLRSPDRAVSERRSS